MGPEREPLAGTPPAAVGADDGGRPVDGRATNKPMTHRPLLMAVLSVFVLTSAVVGAAGPALAGNTTQASTQLDVGVELEQEETVTRGGDVNVSAYVYNRASGPLRNATVSLLVDTDSDGTVEASEAVASQGLNLAAGGNSEVELTYANVGLSPGTYAYAARVTHGNQTTRSYTEGTLTVKANRTAESDASVSRICFDYGQYGGNINLEVNGQQVYQPTKVDATPPQGIDGATVGGATVSVRSSKVSGGRTGHVVITGDIEQFRVGGQELIIDNVEFGPQGSPHATVGFNNLSPAQSTYLVGDQFRADGVDIEVQPFIYASGTTTSNGEGLYQTASPAMSGGVVPDFYPNNVNLAFDVNSAVGAQDEERPEMTEESCGEDIPEDEQEREEEQQQEQREEEQEEREEERENEEREHERKDEQEHEQEQRQEEQRQEEREEEQEHEEHKIADELIDFLPDIDSIPLLPA